jgi:signal transduction histidine kinase
VVLLVAVRWGAALGVLTTLVSAQLYNFCHLPPRYSLAPSGPSEWATLLTFVVVGMVAIVVARLSERASAAEERERQERESRLRVLAAGDAERRRLVRDLHDGAQQRLVHTVLTLDLAQHAFSQHDGTAEAFVGEAGEFASQAIEELRTLVEGVLPPALTSGGLHSAVESLVHRSSIPVTSDVSPERFPPPVEATAYFIIAESLTNVVKHARATTAHVRVSPEPGMLRIEVHDDGVGGVGVNGGSSLPGLQDRVDALNGRLEVRSPPGEGTVVIAALPTST